MMTLVSLQVGMPRTLGTAEASDPMDRLWTSGVFKRPVEGEVEALLTGFVGDGQADVKLHGGPDKAINAYPAEHLAAFSEKLGLTFFPGAFGENMTTAGALESDVCIGDIFRVGTVLVQITQPRQPCWKLARRWRVKELPALLEQAGCTGWYFRVLEPGRVAAPAAFTLVQRAYPQWTVAEANAIMHRRKDDWAAAAALSGCPALSANWQASLGRRAATKTVTSSAARLYGG